MPPEPLTGPQLRAMRHARRWSALDLGKRMGFKSDPRSRVRKLEREPLLTDGMAARVWLAFQEEEPTR